MGRLERYEILTTLPPGAGGRTRLAYQLGGHGFRRTVVLRAVPDGVPPAAAPIRTAGVLPLLDVVEFEGQVWAVYEFIPGATLKELLEVYASVGRLPAVGLVGRVMVDACRALHAMHLYKDPLGKAPAVRHGGVSDASVLVGFDGETRVLDLGARRLSRFIAPEVTRGERFDARADVFSLAAVFHAATTKFGKGYASVVVHAPSPDELPPPSRVNAEASPEIDLAVMKALLPDPTTRPATAGELAERLELALGPQLLSREQVRITLQPLFKPRVEALQALFVQAASRTPQPPVSGGAAPTRDFENTQASPLLPQGAPPKKPTVPWNSMVGDSGGLPFGEPNSDELLGALDDLPTTAGQRPTNPRQGALPAAAWRTGDSEGALGEVAELPTDMRPSKPGLPSLDAAAQDVAELVRSEDIESVGGSSPEERAMAQGQERISTFDLDPSGVGPAPSQSIDVEISLSGTTQAPHRRPGGGFGRFVRRAVIAVLVVLVGSGAAVHFLRPDLEALARAEIDARLGTPPLPIEADAGTELDVATDAGLEAADAGDADAGGVADAGSDADAGAPTVDAGTSADAGHKKGKTKPPKKPKKKKKRAAPAADDDESF